MENQDSNTLCTLCYESPFPRLAIYKCDCNFRACNECIVTWIAQCIFSNIQNENLTIKCPNSECKREHSMNEMREQVILYSEKRKNEESNQLLLQYSEAGLEFLSIHGEDMRKCPNDNCQVAGFIDLEACKDEVICNACEYSWREDAHIGGCRRVMRNFSMGGGRNCKTLTKLHHLLFEEPCPKCGVMIYKDGGCSSIVCGKCRMQICWDCMGSYPGKHEEQTFCPIRAIIIKSLMLFLFIMINAKVGFYYEKVAEIQTIIAYNLSAFLVSMAYIIALISMIGLLGELTCSGKEFPASERLQMIFGECILIAFNACNTFVLFKTDFGQRQLLILAFIISFSLATCIFCACGAFIVHYFMPPYPQQRRHKAPRDYEFFVDDEMLVPLFQEDENSENVSRGSHESGNDNFFK